MVPFAAVALVAATHRRASVLLYYCGRHHRRRERWSSFGAALLVTGGLALSICCISLSVPGTFAAAGTLLGGLTLVLFAGGTVSVSRIDKDGVHLKNVACEID
jgi:hypothetical protein